MVLLRKNIALYCNINAAIIAGYLWERLETQHKTPDTTFKYEHYWTRCSQLMMTGEYPFMTIHMVKDAIDLLIKKHIIKKAHFNNSRFDRTNWYAFTDYGIKLMKEDDKHETKSIGRQKNTDT